MSLGQQRLSPAEGALRSSPRGGESANQIRYRKRHGKEAGRCNVGRSERAVFMAAGTLLALVGLGRRSIPGLVVAGVGGALAARGATGYCPVYQAIDVNHADELLLLGRSHPADSGVHVSCSYLINKSPQVLYSFWRNFENLPQFMTHLESVRVTGLQHSHWVAKAPSLYGGYVEWDAEITAEEPDAYIAWRSVSGSDITHEGSIRFTKALGDRGTNVSVAMKYKPPFGQVGRWIAKLFGEEPHQQLNDDLRQFKRLMELGELPTITGQPRGTCSGQGERSFE
jgi:uncharacterized membrane protein